MMKSMRKLAFPMGFAAVAIIVSAITMCTKNKFLPKAQQR